MRDLFRAIVQASRSTKCAEYAERLGRNEDGGRYRTLASDARAAIDPYL